MEKLLLIPSICFLALECSTPQKAITYAPFENPFVYALTAPMRIAFACLGDDRKSYPENEPYFAEPDVVVVDNMRYQLNTEKGYKHDLAKQISLVISAHLDNSRLFEEFYFTDRPDTSITIYRENLLILPEAKSIFRPMNIDSWVWLPHMITQRVLWQQHQLP